MNWQAVTAISSVVSTVIVIAGASLAWRQWREASAARQLAAILAFISRFQDGSLRGLKAYLKQNASTIDEILRGTDPLARLNALLVQNNGQGGSPSSLAELRKSFADLEFVAVLCLNDSVPRTLERAYLAPTMSGYWKAIFPVVSAIREGEVSPVYLQHAEALVLMIADGTLFDKNPRKIKRRKLRQLSIRGADGGRLRLNELGHQPSPD